MVCEYEKAVMKPSVQLEPLHCLATASSFEYTHLAGDPGEVKAHAKKAANSYLPAMKIDLCKLADSGCNRKELTLS